MIVIQPRPFTRLASQRLLYLCIGGIAAGLCSGIASAADASTGGDAGSENGLEEIVVTANRREENLSKVPISVSAYTQESMDVRGIKDFTDIVRFTPGVTIDADQTNSISIRGISSSGGAGTTGIYIDDTPIQIRALGFNPDDTLPKTFDLDRVEVLRGPQGTLFGAGSEGGTVRYIMTQPSLDKFSSYARSEVSYTEGGAPSYEAGLAVGGPIIQDVLGFRVSAWYRRDGGWIDRIDPTSLDIVDKNANHDETSVLRAAATWAPVSSVKITPAIVYQDRERNDISVWWPLYSDPNADRYESANPTPRGEPDKYLLPSLKITADFDAVQFISNSSYYHRSDISGYDGTLYNLSYYQTIGWPNSGFGGTDNAGNALPLNCGSGSRATPPCSWYPLLDGSGVHLPPGLSDYRSPATVTNKQDNVSQEFRLQSNDPAARIVWTLGAFFSVNRTFSLEEIHDPMVDQLFNVLYGDTIADIFGTPTNPNGSSYLPMGDSYLNQITGHDRQLAGFGEAVWSITDQLKLTTGIRYSKVDYTFESYADGPQNGGAVYGNGSDHEKPLTYRGGLSFQQDPNNLYYATYSTGFRIGGANTVIPYLECQQDFTNFGISDNPATYKSDTVKSYEIGAKNNFDNRIRLASSAYYIKWNNIQQNVTLPSCELSYITNLGSAVSEGMDLQADFAITDAFTIESAFGYNDAHYTSNAYPGAPVGSPLTAKGDAIVGQSGTPGAPWTMTVGAEYKFRAFGNDSYARMDYEHETKNNRQTASEDSSTLQYAACTTNTAATQTCNYNPSSTTFVSARAGMLFGGWNLSAFIDNLFDAHPTTEYNFTGTDPFTPNAIPTPLYRNFSFRPRTVGLTLTYRQ